MPNFNSIGSGVLEPQVAENRYLPLTRGTSIALTTVYAVHTNVLTVYCSVTIYSSVGYTAYSHHYCYNVCEATRYERLPAR